VPRPVFTTWPPDRAQMLATFASQQSFDATAVFTPASTDGVEGSAAVAPAGGGSRSDNGYHCHAPHIEAPCSQFPSTSQ
jgi:hypothetical protein